MGLMFDMLSCRSCGWIDMSTMTVCPQCLGAELAPVAVDGAGSLVSWTTIRRAPTQFRDQAPYQVCVVDLQNGRRVTGRLADGGRPAIGIGVEIVSIQDKTPVFTIKSKG